MSTKKLKKEMILEKIEQVTKKNIEQELLIGYYQSIIAKSDDKKTISETQMKIEQMKAAVEFNDGYLEYVAHLLADLD